MPTQTIPAKRKALPPATEEEQMPAVSDEGVMPPPDDGGVHTEPGVGGEDMEAKGLMDGGTEPYGAQVCRRIHQDHTILLEEYDDMMQHLEDNATRKLLEGLLAGLDKTMTLIEDHFQGHERYKDLPGLEGADMEAMEDKKGMGESDMGTDQGTPPEGSDIPEETEKQLDADEDDSGAQDVPTGEEALAGMEADHETEDERTKALRIHYIKALRQYVRQKDMGIEEGHEPGMEAIHEEGKDMPIYEQTEAVNVNQPEGLNLLPHHVSDLAEAHAFLKDLSDVQDFGEPHRQKAYHHHKALNAIADHHKSEFVGDRNYWQEESMEPEHKALLNAVGLRLHLQKRFKELKDSMDEDDKEEKKFLKKRWAKIGKSFPELDRQDSQVNINDPTSPNSHVKPGEDAAIMAWKPSESIIRKFHKFLQATNFPKLKQQDEQVEISQPSGPTKLGGTDPHQQFSGASLVTGRKDMDPLATQDDASNVMHPHLKAIKDAADYFGEVAHEKAFGEHHRQMAMQHHKALEPVVQPEPMAEPDEGGDIMAESPPAEPGEMGEKSLRTDIRNQRRELLNQRKAAAQLRIEMEKLTAGIS